MNAGGPSEGRSAATATSQRWRRGGRIHRRSLLRRADQYSMRNRQNEGLLDSIVGQSDHTTSAFQELERLPMPPVFHLQEVPEVPASAGQFFDSSTIQCPCTLVVSLFRYQLDRHVNVTQPLRVGIQHASEKYDPGNIGEKIGILFNPSHTLKELRQGPLRGQPCDRFGRRG